MLVGSWYCFGSLGNFGETGQFLFGVFEQDGSVWNLSTCLKIGHHGV